MSSEGFLNLPYLTIRPVTLMEKARELFDTEESIGLPMFTCMDPFSTVARHAMVTCTNHFSRRRTTLPSLELSPGRSVPGHPYLLDNTAS